MSIRTYVEIRPGTPIREMSAVGLTVADFTNIPPYANLTIKYVAADTQPGAGLVALRAMINGDNNAGHYTYTSLYGGQTAGGGAITAMLNTVTPSASGLWVGAIGQGSAVWPASGEILFPGANGTAFGKTFISHAEYFDTTIIYNVTTMGHNPTITAPINRLTFTTDGTSFRAGSIFQLYGH